MNSLQKSYHAFIESVCAELGCGELARPLQEGLVAICEGMTPGNLDLVRYFRNLDIEGEEDDRPLSFRDEENFWDPRPHFDRWIVHNTQAADRIYEEGFRRGMHIGKLANTWGSYNKPSDRMGGTVAFGTPIEDAKPLDDDTDLIWGSNWIDCGGSIVCKVSGVTAYHRDDQEDQVMFDINSPKGCFWIRNTGFRSRCKGMFQMDNDSEDAGVPDSYEVIGKNPNRPLCTGTYDRCIRWCRDNGDAYAHMMKRWKSPGNTTKTESMMAWKPNSLCEADTGDTRNGSAWADVERIHVYHAADPRMDMDIELDSLWATRQKDSATREDVIGRFIEDAADFNKWIATSKDGGAFITTAAIKFKGDPNEVTVKIPCLHSD